MDILLLAKVMDSSLYIQTNKQKVKSNKENS